MRQLLLLGLVSFSCAQSNAHDVVGRRDRVIDEIFEDITPG